MPGGSVYELKFDGYRARLENGADGVRMWSRQGRELTARFPETVRAAGEQLPPGSYVDGEVVAYNGTRLDFDLLQRRLTIGPARISALVQEHPASFIAFDLLAAGGEDLRPGPWQERRALLEALGPWRPPLQLCPYTLDVDEARRWMADYRPAGIEGLVVKGADSPYVAGSRVGGWVKLKPRDTLEVLVGAVLGPLSRPESIVAGLYRDGRLVMVGRSSPLSTAQALSLRLVLRPAGDGHHPWPATVASSRFGRSRDRVALTRVEPTVVAEVSADSALQAGAWRHPLKFVRHRPDLTPADLPPLP